MARPRKALPPASAIIALVDGQGRLAIRAAPNARSDAILLTATGAEPALLVRTPAPPEGGRANEAILVLVAEALGRPRSALSLLRGATSRNKLIHIFPE